MTMLRLAAAAAFTLSATLSALAHDNEPHACKKGYVMTSDHKCVKK